jgi:hypothetical protein
LRPCAAWNALQSAGIEALDDLIADLEQALA